MIVSQERLREVLYYDAITGYFTWKASNNGRVGLVAGSEDGAGYNVIRVDGTLYRAGRLAWFYVHGYWPDEIDHKNRIISDDSINNLRDCTPQQNKAHRSIFNNSISQVKGVRLRPSGRYEARIRVNYVLIHLGTFDTLAEASEVYRLASIDYFGEFAHE